MKFLIAGFGSIGRRHFRNLIALGEKDLFFLRSHKSHLPDEEISGYPTYEDIGSALTQNPDAVIVANPSALHLDVAIPAAKRGCHILMEKPLSDGLVHVPELVEAVETNKSRLLMGFQFRFHPGLRRIGELISEGTIGRILSVRAHWGEYLPDWHPWEDYRKSYSAQARLGGGVILTLCHPLDYLRWLVGEVEDLWAFSGKLGDLDLAVEDTAEIGVRFDNGAFGSIHLSYNQRPTMHTLEMVGTGGSLQWNNATGITSWYPSETGEWRSMELPGGFERNQLFRSEMEHFINVVKGDEQPVCTLNDGIAALKLALAAKQSAQFGQLVEIR
ncbi:MAG: Gfo/Idh/MocA family protein [Anaerolineales bacterium]|jgi:predicted dehydrogenase